MHSPKSLLFNDTAVWIKSSYLDFKVTMGSFDGVEICKLVDVYLLNVLPEKYGKRRVGLCRDNSLACFKNASELQAEKIRKHGIKIFKQRIRPQYYQ